METKNKPMITINAPEISKDQANQLAAHKSRIQKVLTKLESDFSKVEELQTKAQELRNKIQSLQRDAAKFVEGSELELLATQKTLERLLVATKEAEEEYSKTQDYLFPATHQAEEFVAMLCQPCRGVLVERISAALSPFYTGLGWARQIAVQTPAHRDLIFHLLTLKSSPSVAIDGNLQHAETVLKRIDAILSSDAIWSFAGCPES
jgi:uncharacterized phage infection (PIP) family protein YhgE